MAKSKPGTDVRRRLITLIHVARAELGMQDEDYRKMLAEMPALGGRTSSADLGIKGLELVLEALKDKGFKPRPKAAKAKPAVTHSRALADDNQSKLIRSLWIQLYEAGAVKNPSETALAHYVCRIAKIEALQWLNGTQASKVIETLKKWLNRTINPTARSK